MPDWAWDQVPWERWWDLFSGAASVVIDFGDGVSNFSGAIVVRSPDAQNRATCTFNINISGVTGQQLTVMENEIRRVFDSADLQVVFGQPDLANGGSWNVLVTPEFTGRVAASLGSDINNVGRLGRTLVGSGESQVNSTHIILTHGGNMLVRPQNFASYDTIFGRIAAHEVIAHGFIPRVSHPVLLPEDITKPWSQQEGVRMSGGRFTISGETANLLRSNCP